MSNPYLCTSCQGMGYHDVGDCEDGVTEVCPECDGRGEIDDNDQLRAYICLCNAGYLDSA